MMAPNSNAIKEPQPGPSYRIKKEFEHRLSLIEHEEEPAQNDSLVHSSKEKKQIIYSTPNSNDIYCPGYEPEIEPPPSRPPLEECNPLWFIWNVIIYVVLTSAFFVVVAPVLLAISVLFGFLPRLILKYALKALFGIRIQLLPISRVFGSTQGNLHTVMLVCRGRCDIEKIRDHITAIISATDPNTGESKFSHLLHRVANYMGFLCLESRASRFDIKNHVKHFDIRSKNVRVDAEDITPFLESTYENPFENPLTQPQWEVLVIPKYGHRQADFNLLDEAVKQKRLYALVFRFHNGIMDWNMFQQLLVEFIGRTGGRVRSIFSPAPVKQKSKLMTFLELVKICVAAILVGPYHFMLKLLKDSNRFARLMKQQHQKISFSVTKPFSSETIEDITHRTYTHIDSVLLSCVRIALRNMALGQNVELPRGLSTTRVFNTLSNSIPGIDYLWVNFHKYRCGLQRLHASHVAAGRNLIWKGGVRGFNKCLIFLTGAFPERLAGWFHSILTKGDVVVEIWPGADEPCKVFGGDVVADIFGWSGISGLEPDFKITVTEYCGRIRAGVAGKIGKLSRKYYDADVIAREFEEEYKLIAAIAGIYPNRLFMPPSVDISGGCEEEAH